MKKKLLCCLLLLALCAQATAVFAASDLPTAENVKISGIEKPGAVLTLHYDFIDANKQPDKSSVQWEYSDDNASFFSISGALGRTLAVNEAYVGKYIRASILPINTLNITGGRVYSASVGPVLPAAVADGLYDSAGATKSMGYYFDTVTDLQTLGIIEKVSQEEVRLGETITRAEFAKVISKASGWDNSGTFFEARFTDVSPEHWAAVYISYAGALGVFDGYEDGTFRPEGDILLQEAVKVVVTLLGYKVQAAELGYPIGYVTRAHSLGLLRGVSASAEAPAIRSDVFQIIKNALDIDLMTQSSITSDGLNSYEIIAGNTLRNALLAGKGFFEGAGVITAIYEAFLLDANSAIKRDEVEIDGLRYKIGTTRAKDYFGEKIYFSALVDDNTGERILNTISPHANTRTLYINRDEYAGYQNFEVGHTIDGSPTVRRAKIAKNAAILYNNRPITDWAQFDIKNGNIKLIDNSGDGAYDVVLISDYISVPIDGINIDSRIIKIKDGLYYNGIASILFDRDDNDVQKVIYGSGGEEISLEDMEPDGVVSIFESGNGDFLKLIYSNDTAEGEISEISDDVFIIGGESYEYEKGAAISKEPIVPGSEVLLYLSFDGKIAFVDVKKNQSESYGYIIDVQRQGLGAAEVYMLIAGAVQQRMEDPDNDPETDNDVTVLLAYNEQAKVMTLAKRFSFRTAGAASSVTTSDLSLIPKGQIVKFRINADGDISSIICSQGHNPGVSLSTYSAAENIFYNASGIPFGIDESTLSLCIPTNIVNGGDDYRAEVKLNDRQSYTVYGYDFNEDNSNVALIAIHSNMNYASSDSIGATTQIAVVQKKTEALDDNGEPTTRLSLLTEGMVKQMTVAEYAERSRIDSLSEGDIIYYSQNPRRELVDVEPVTSLSDTDTYYNVNKNLSNENVFGMADDIVLKRISTDLNRRVSHLFIQVDENNRERTELFEVHTRNAPPVFIYERRSAAVSFGTMDDIRTYRSGGYKGDEIFMRVKNGMVQCVAIVRD